MSYRSPIQPRQAIAVQIPVTPTKLLRGVALAASFSLLCFAQQARAVVLEQKWQVGQQLPYDVALKGTANFETDALWAGPIANVPVDVALSGNGQFVLNTISVAPNGHGTIQVKMPQLLMKAGAFGMNATLKTVGNVGTFGLNGGTPKTFDATKFANPTTAIVVSPTGQIQGIAPLAIALESATNATTSKAVQTSATRNATSSTRSTSTRLSAQTSVGASADATTDNAAQTMQNIVRLMPQLWPGRDIAVGESWTIDVKIPLGANADAAPLSVGTLTMKLVGEENAAGRVLQRVNVSGTIDISGAKAQAINDAIKSNKDAPRVVAANQTVNGDVLFDAEAGQIARAWFKVVAKNEMRGTTPAKDKQRAASWTLKNGFSGTLQMQQIVSN